MHYWKHTLLYLGYLTYIKASITYIRPIYQIKVARLIEADTVEIGKSLLLFGVQLYKRIDHDESQHTDSICRGTVDQFLGCWEVRPVGNGIIRRLFRRITCRHLNRHK